MIDAENALATSPPEDIPTRQEEVKARHKFGPDPRRRGRRSAQSRLGREEFFSDQPALKSKLQPHNLVDCGDGILQMSLGFQFPMGDGTLTVAWAKRSWQISR